MAGRKEKNSFLIYYDVFNTVKNALNDEQLGEYLRNIGIYEIDGERKTSGDPVVNAYCTMAYDTLDRDKAKYQQRCDKNKANQDERWRKEREQQRKAEQYDRIQSNTNDTDIDIESDRDIDNDRDNKGVSEHMSLYDNISDAYP
ncbi:MAG: DUF6291 domain-containing protein [Eubacteriaceae bacterium]|jgi:hypothetical protein|nr:DUF6291 domain-containing protein [Eubacteriaceae bacterium]